VKIFIAIPVFDGKLQSPTVGCLLTEQSIAHGVGDELLVYFLPNCSNLTLGRDMLVKRFLESDCERMFFLDADITFEPGALLKLCHRPEDFVAGCTRYKKDVESYPIRWLPKAELWLDENGLLEIQMVGTAFMSLSRNVFKVIKDSAPGREYENYGEVFNCYFEMPFKDRTLYGEDGYFCKSWRDAGGKIFIDPELEITHWDFNKPYAGHIGKWLKNRMNNQQGENHENLSEI
jgi:hypothetical protein